MSRSYDLRLPERRQSQNSHTHNDVRRSVGRRATDRVLAGKHPIAACIFRAALYVLVTALFLKAVFYAAQHIGVEDLFAENGMMEWFQFGTLVSCAILLFVASSRMPELREGFHLLALLPLMLSMRELDAVLDDYVFDGAWQLLVIIIFLYIVAFTWQHYEDIKQHIRQIFSFPSTGLLLSGFVTVVVFSRLFGQQLFWQAILQQDYLRVVARAVEESSESFGYLLLLFACAEYVVIALSSRAYVQPPALD